jgi:UPF0716 protein FxsA
VGVLVLVLLLAVPVLELWVFVQVADAIGFWWALLALIALSVIGAWVVKIQGLHTLRRIRQRTESGQAPTREVADAAMLVVAGLLLLFPGFVTGALGVLLLLPPVRAMLRPFLVGRSQVQVITATTTGPLRDDGVVDTTATEIKGELDQ